MAFDKSSAVGTAVLLGIVLAIPAWRYIDSWWSGVPIHRIAGRGEPTKLTLKDGTRVLLDADSELVVKIGVGARRVALARGEAFFDVVHETSWPFQVEVGRGLVTALGTQFDVERLSDSSRVTVFEGRVGLKTPQGEVALSAGQSSGYENSGDLLSVNTVTRSGPFWQDGQRYFDSEPLADVVQRLARYHAVTFTFADPRLERLRVSGTFRTDDLSLFLRTLSAAFPVQARWVDSQHMEFIPRVDGHGKGIQEHTH